MGFELFACPTCLLLSWYVSPSSITRYLLSFITYTDNAPQLLGSCLELPGLPGTAKARTSTNAKPCSPPVGSGWPSGELPHHFRPPIVPDAHPRGGPELGCQASNCSGKCPFQSTKSTEWPPTDDRSPPLTEQQPPTATATGKINNL
ncbi:hypothetical protein B0H65DRAFT_439609 [Neurospora tetraspora]|uniref:Questionable protein n=1 Tax=Neurospora tetraspora TaxID=94610 RepID=A0AAE0JJ29_9PEZI|nr:hypothetical protein B0H65DRAFT_439609 [Neurospora tetraspora]